MKHKLIIAIVCLSLVSCWLTDDDVGGASFTSAYTPVILSRTDFENSITVQAARPIEETGKIYVIGNYLFVNEPYVGFHIINNANPSSPVVEKFLTTPGVTDIIFKGESFYINQAVDLVALKFADGMTNVIETKRVKNVFPVIWAPDGSYTEVTEDEVVVNWTLN
ncbi:hypothetical protein KORDIASMS9_04712 [Kordia sp. SMS9]|uniref:hypothetical protein n=1 Tax=Kordia sp. SMS9 TaxID=2282170 RepID=UPI000E0D31F6|nr:hypothetical protein [Kordia sp. SMS9]AXG72438.1 hypothetical protein KORDIASMS9_04712 [Kordia sp. SMS9]